MTILLKTNSEEYGEYYARCIGIVDFPLMLDTMSTDDYFAWSETFHPVKYFSGLSMLRLVERKIELGAKRSIYRVAIFVPVQEDNLNWKPKKGKKKKLPICSNDERIKKWQKSNMLLTPDYMKKAIEIDDLQKQIKEGDMKISLSKEIRSRLIILEN